MKNRHAARSKNSEAKIQENCETVCRWLLDSLQIGQTVGANVNPEQKYLAAFRECIANFCAAEFPVQGEVEVDESYFLRLPS